MSSIPSSAAAPAALDASVSRDGGWTPRSIYMLALLTLAYAFNYFDRLLISLLFPLIQADLKLTDTELGLITGVAFVLIYAVMGLPIARLADRWNRKMIIGIGFSFWSAMTLATGFVTNVWQMAAARFLMGAGEAAGTPPSTSLLSDIFDKKHRPLAFSIMASGTAISGLVFTPIAGWMGHLYGWRVVYWVAGCVGLGLGLLMMLTVREPQRGRFDDKAPDGEAAKPTFKSSLAFLLKRRTYVFATLGAALVTISFYAHIVWSTTFMLRVHGMSVAESASLLGPIRGISGLVGAIGGGILLARLLRYDERWRIWLPALCFTAVGLSQYVFLFSTNILFVAIGAAIDSVAASMMVPLLSLLLIQVMPVPIRSFGMALYVLSIAILGQIIGPLGVGILNDQLATIWQDEAIRYSMAITAFVGVIAGPIMLRAGRHLSSDTAEARTWSGA
ncbi:spinster family MFS transporter [Sphingobium sp. B12D2B]|uniref:spinster family MFS transporter n=2 Tax=unclassified Sphingobium TaxID=2611147 RepID=UPI002224EF52|nr:MFS transporter [Sphingobium sp. B12D2B]MCW2351579.1 MFS family permease [Sphingobium sp. B12D2B]